MCINVSLGVKPTIKYNMLFVGDRTIDLNTFRDCKRRVVIGKYTFVCRGVGIFEHEDGIAITTTESITDTIPIYKKAYNPDDNYMSYYWYNLEDQKMYEDETMLYHYDPVSGMKVNIKDDGYFIVTPSEGDSVTYLFDELHGVTQGKLYYSYWGVAIMVSIIEGIVKSKTMGPCKGLKCGVSGGNILIPSDIGDIISYGEDKTCVIESRFSSSRIVNNRYYLKGPSGSYIFNHATSKMINIKDAPNGDIIEGGPDNVFIMFTGVNVWVWSI